MIKLDKAFRLLALLLVLIGYSCCSKTKDEGKIV